MQLFKRVMLMACCYSFTTLNFASSISSFASGEHLILGDNIKVYIDEREPTPPHYFTLPNGLTLTYGDLLTFGDFFGSPAEPISQSDSEAEKRRRFMNAFNAFAIDPAGGAEAKQILDVVHNERDMLIDGMKMGKTPEEIYKSIGNENDRKLNCITGGGCDENTWWLTPGRYLQLLTTNYDHFQQNAIDTYLIGHQLAIEKAQEARLTTNLQTLDMAYAINAFACHFLSDRYATGHVRTPRKELQKEVTPPLVGSLLADYMHDEENFYGFHVHNKLGESWFAYGDKSYFNPRNAKHREHIQQILQASAEQVFEAFIGGKPTNEGLLQLLPQPDEKNNQNVKDLSPMFYWEETTGLVMRRVDLYNPFDRHFTNDWWGWTTLIELNKKGGLPLALQQRLATSSLAKQALHDGLITNKNILKTLNLSAIKPRLEGLR